MRAGIVSFMKVKESREKRNHMITEGQEQSRAINEVKTSDIHGGIINDYKH